jgi:hypothetical protein
MAHLAQVESGSGSIGQKMRKSNASSRVGVKREEANVKRGTLSLGIVLPVTLVALTLIVLILMNQIPA